MANFVLHVKKQNIWTMNEVCWKELDMQSLRGNEVKFEVNKIDWEHILQTLTLVTSMESWVSW